MNNIIKKSLKKSFLFLFGIQLLLIIILSVFVLFLYQNQDNLAKSRDRNYESYQLADQLRQSSDDLTRLARTYAVTGNPEFEREYWAILDIRNGKIPRPLDYDNIYWDFVAVDGQKPRGDGEAISLHDLMVKEGFADAELAKLSLAQKNSDGLVNTEMIAMNAVKGLFDDGSGNFTIKKEPDREMAIRILHDANYHKIKAEIMKPIDDFYLLFEKRTGDDVAGYLQIANNLFLIIIALVLIILITLIFSIIRIIHRINENEALNKQLEVLSNELTEQKNTVEQKVKDRTAELEKLNSFMSDRELKMVELKKEITNLKNK